jgi:hypothetical protein
LENIVAFHVEMNETARSPLFCQRVDQRSEGREGLQDPHRLQIAVAGLAVESVIRSMKE